MKKLIAIALLVCLLALSLSACSDLLGGGGSSTAPAVTAAPAQQTAEPAATATAAPEVTDAPEAEASPAA